MTRWRREAVCRSGAIASSRRQLEAARSSTSSGQPAAPSRERSRFDETSRRRSDVSEASDGSAARVLWATERRWSNGHPRGRASIDVSELNERLSSRSEWWEVTDGGTARSSRIDRSSSVGSTADDDAAAAAAGRGGADGRGRVGCDGGSAARARRRARLGRRRKRGLGRRRAHAPPTPALAAAAGLAAAGGAASSGASTSDAGRPAGRRRWRRVDGVVCRQRLADTSSK